MNLELKSGYIYNPLIPHWDEEKPNSRSGECYHIKNERVNLFNAHGISYLFVGSASKHLIKLKLNSMNGASEDYSPKRSLLWWGTFAIYANNQPILDGIVWQAIDFPNHDRFPEFQRILIGNQSPDNTDKRIEEVMKKYEESIKIYESLIKPLE
ncbi:MAG: hypothetical protein Q7S56_03360 [Nanoarchaeota archaeon]|nr:hypothetical protein [Nanoarchaeota archaeon]